jgi:arylsulfatase A
MSPRYPVIHLLLSALWLLGSNPSAAAPNVVLILVDDLGYGDAPGYGDQAYDLPNLSRLAQEGMRFTDYYSASTVCSAARASLLTGRYGVKTGVTGVISANTSVALPLEEVTLAERYRKLGYATAIFGKWHLGNQPSHWPLQQGFDQWLGTIGSNDMGKGQPSLEQRRLGRAGVELVENQRIIETNPDQRHLTRRYTERAIDFIRQQHHQPFFLYVPHNMPHTPLFVSERFDGHSGRGLYGDVLAELDWSLGEIMRTLDDQKLTDNTILIFTSDNGPWLIFGNHGGTAGILDGGKKQTLEGGSRVPLIVRWPGHIPAGSTCNQWVSALDFTPTLMQLSGENVAHEKKLHGRDLSSWWLGDLSAPVPDRSYFFYYERELQALRHNNWKLRLPHTDTQAPDPEQIGHDGERGAIMKVPRTQALFDLSTDPSETRDLSAQHPDILQKMLQLAERGKALARPQRNPPSTTNSKP